MMAMSQTELQRMNVDPVSFAMNMIGIQVKVLIRELWPEQRDQLLFDHKVAMELEKAVEEMASEVRKQQLIQGVGMTPPNRAARRREERGGPRRG